MSNNTSGGLIPTARKHHEERVLSPLAGAVYWKRSAAARRDDDAEASEVGGTSLASLRRPDPFFAGVSFVLRGRSQHALCLGFVAAHDASVASRQVRGPQVEEGREVGPLVTFGEAHLLVCKLVAPVFVDTPVKLACTQNPGQSAWALSRLSTPHDGDERGGMNSPSWNTGATGRERERQRERQ